jgi:hypothetical protein
MCGAGSRMGGQLRRANEEGTPCPAVAATESPPPSAKQNPNKVNTNLVPTLEQRRTQHQHQRSMIISICNPAMAEEGTSILRTALPCLQVTPGRAGIVPSKHLASLLQPLHSRANHRRRYRFYFGAFHPRLVAFFIRLSPNHRPSNTRQLLETV